MLDLTVLAAPVQHDVIACRLLQESVLPACVGTTHLESHMLMRSMAAMQVLFYTPLGMGKLGESWSIYSWIQAAG